MTRAQDTLESVSHLAVFDIDGTLIRHLAAGNDKCYLRAVEEEWGITGLRDEVSTWAGFAHASDSSVTDELFRRKHARAHTPDEVTKLKDRLMALLAREFPSGGPGFEPVAGAVGLFEAVRGTGAWDVAIATGNWECSARFKLANAGLWEDGVPLATADDGLSKAEIIAKAVERAEAVRGGRYRRTVYVGDSTRDVDAAAELQIGFLGIGRGAGVIELMDAGAVTIFRDFADREVFLGSLREFER